jgi:hypothetical protein
MVRRIYVLTFLVTCIFILCLNFIFATNCGMHYEPMLAFRAFLNNTFFIGVIKFFYRKFNVLF